MLSSLISYNLNPIAHDPKKMLRRTKPEQDPARIAAKKLHDVLSALAAKSKVKNKYAIVNNACHKYLKVIFLFFFFENDKAIKKNKKTHKKWKTLEIK